MSEYSRRSWGGRRRSRPLRGRGRRRPAARPARPCCSRRERVRPARARARSGGCKTGPVGVPPGYRPARPRLEPRAPHPACPGRLPSLQSPPPREPSHAGHASVFKAYDIRGIVGKTIDARFAEQLGRAFGSEALAAGERAVAVGRDGRLSGPELRAALIRGLASTGLDVVDLGMVTTPMLYYVAATRGRHGCQRHPGHGQPQPAGLQRLQDGARRPRHLRRRHPGLRRRIEADDVRRRPRPHARRWTSSPSTARASSATASWRGR